MKSILALFAISTLTFLLGSPLALALNPFLDASQYAHTAWTVRDGFSLGNIYAMVQTPDGYLWLGTEFGLFRFDGFRSVPWQTAEGQQLPDRNINSLLVTRDGTLWIGTFAGLVTWSGGKLTPRPEQELAKEFVASLFEDSEGTVWAAAESGLWRIKPGPPKQYPASTELVGLNRTNEGRLLIAIHSAGLRQLVGDKLESYPVRSSINSKEFLSDRDLDANRVLRDRDGGLWIGTVERGLNHVHHGRTDVFKKADGLSGDVILSLFEDREGNIWVSTTGGLDRFRELPVATVSVKQGLSSDATQAVLAAKDGSVWVGSHEGLSLLQNGEATIFGRGSGLPDDQTGSLFQDNTGRIWLSTSDGLAYFKDGSFIATAALRSGKIHYISGDKAGNLWLSAEKGLFHLQGERLVEQIPWKAFERQQQANVVLSDGETGGVWLGFWVDGGVSYFQDNQIRVSYTTTDGLGQGPVPDLRIGPDGALWVATEYGGLSRIKDGRIATITTKNGLPCNTVNGTVEDGDRSLWLYAGCGLVRILRSELDAWIADPKRKVQMTIWDAADGVRLRSSAASEYGPRVAKSTDGRLWFVTGEGIQVVDPHHLAFNNVQPSVHIEQIVADHKNYWQNITGTAMSNLRLPARTRDLKITYTALSLVAPEKVHFKYMLEGQDQDWKEVVNDRQAQYTNLGPRHYRFRVIASNNSGVWNDQGDVLEFSIAPAYYQSNWFRALCVVAVLALILAAYQLRIQQLRHQFEMTLDARVGERTRIARELHDTLLQSFHGILLHLQTVSNELSSGQTKQKLDSAIDQAAKAIVEGRDAVQGLRMSTIQGNDLALAIRTLGEELVASGSGTLQPRFDVHVEGTPRDLHPIVRDEVYRIAGEALRNAFRHANAQRIEVELSYDGQHLVLRVRDDGKGIDTQHLGESGSGGHFGLRGMLERSKVIGGNLKLWSERDTGAEVELSIPAERAYDVTVERHPSRLLERLLGKLSRKHAERKRGALV